MSTIILKVPALAERKEDLPLLERHLLERFARDYGKPLRGLTQRAQVALAAYSWPGNVRELENVLDRACMMAKGEFIDLRDLPSAILERRASDLFVGNGSNGSASRLETLDEHQGKYVAQVLNRLHGNKSEAARVLGVSRATLYRMLSTTLVAAER